MKIKEFDFGFENCEVIKFNGEDANSFYLGRICSTIRQFRKDGATEMKTTEDVAIVLEPTANTKEHQSSFGINYGDKRDMPFNRITLYDDITSIGVTFLNDDGTETQEEYYPIYEDADYNGEENKCQLSYVTNKGYLILLINKDIAENRDKILKSLEEDYYWLFNDENESEN